MDCRIIRSLTLKADGHIVCDDSNGYGILLGEASTGPSWSIRRVIDGPVYAHVRRAFAEGRVPWPGVCETCHTFSAGGAAEDTLDTRMRLLVEPTLRCDLACPSCMRKREGRTRAGGWDLDPALFEALLRSCAREGIALEEVHYLGWGEPLLSRDIAVMTRLVREWHPRCVQEATTSGSVEFDPEFEVMDLDKLTVSCDGVRQDSYARYRRGGDIAKVHALMQSLHRLRFRPFVEWKYILFAHNDADEDVLTAQRLAAEWGIDSLLFIVTSSKGASRRFTADTLGGFPVLHDFVQVSPDARSMTTREAGTVVPAMSTLGHGEQVSLFLDQVRVTASNILELRGWALRADGGYVDRVTCLDGARRLGATRPNQRRTDVPLARPHAAGPDCGFAMLVPLRPGQRHDELDFEVEAGDLRQRFTATIDYG